MKFRRLISPRYNYNLHTIHPNIFKSKDLNFSSLFFYLENAKRGIWLKRSRETNTYGAEINSLFYILIRLLLSAKDGHGTGRDSAASFVQCHSPQGLIMSGQLREILSQSRSAGPQISFQVPAHRVPKCRNFLSRSIFVQKTFVPVPTVPRL